MSHHLHFFAVVAKTGEGAMSDVQSSIENWGDENNWRRTAFAVCVKDNTITQGDSDRYDGTDDEDKPLTIAKIGEIMDSVIGSTDGQQELLDLAERVKKKDRFGKRDDWLLAYRASKYATLISDRLYDGFNGSKQFDPLKDEFRGTQYEEIGFTNLCDGKTPTHIVAMDIHT